LNIGNNQNIRSIDWSPDDTQLIATSEAGVVRIWSVPSDIPARFTPDDTLAAHEGRVNGAIWNSTGDQLATIGDDGVLSLWTAADHASVLQLGGLHNASITSVAWGPGPVSIATGGCDGSVALIDVASQRVTQQLTGHHGCVSGLAFSVDGQYLWSADTTGRLRVWDLATYAVVAERENLHAGRINALIATDGARFVTTGADGILQIWRYETETGSLKEVIAQTVSNAQITAADWNMSDNTLFTGSAAGRIQLWNTPFDTNANVEFGQSSAAIVALDANRTTRYLAGIDQNGCLTLWTISTAEKLFAECEPSARAYRSLDWSPNTDVLATSTEQGDIIFWHVP
jgi:WD40 repeat protein